MTTLALSAHGPDAPAAGPASLVGHLSELRQRLLWCALAFAAAFVMCYHFSETIYLFLARPLADLMRARGQQPHLIYTALTEAFFTYIKVAAFGALFLSFPLAATQIWRFVAPGLFRHEKRVVLPFLLATPVLFLLGGALAYTVICPFAWRFFLSFETAPGTGGVAIELQAKVGEYLALMMKLMFGFGVAFELPVLLALCALAGLVTPATLRKFRRYSYVGCFVAAAVLAPPDIITMIGLAIPLIILYEVSIIAVSLVRRSAVRSWD